MPEVVRIRAPLHLHPRKDVGQHGAPGPPGIAWGPAGRSIGFDCLRIERRDAFGDSICRSVTRSDRGTPALKDGDQLRAGQTAGSAATGLARSPGSGRAPPSAAISCPARLWQSVQSMTRRSPAASSDRRLLRPRRCSLASPFESLTRTNGMVSRVAAVAMYSIARLRAGVPMNAARAAASQAAAADSASSSSSLVRSIASSSE